ncbi:MAG: pyridoxamine 5'-phosphate oxidase [Pseudomonadota bacterium]
MADGDQLATDASAAERGFLAEHDPFSLFDRWFLEAEADEVNDHNAMALATVDATGMPNVRVVLLKGLDQADAGAARGFVFYTNFESAKGQELLGNGKAALNFHWKGLRRQVRIRGNVAAVSTSEADAYYSSRPRGSQIGAWASQQSRPLAGRAELEAAASAAAERFGDGPVPRPTHWSGFRVVPLQIEFWHDRPYRLHDRLLFERTTPDAAWERRQLYP